MKGVHYNERNQQNDLHKVVLVGKGPELQTLFSIIGYNSINCGTFGLNWDCINLYDGLYSEFSQFEVQQKYT